MSETDAAQVQETEQPKPDSEKSFDAEYVDKLRKENARYRTEAKANADAAKKLAEIEAANKTEAQKTADRIAALEAEAQRAKSDALRSRIAAANGISAEDADLFLTGDDEDTLTRQAKRLADRDKAVKQGGNHVPTEGKTPTQAGGDAAFVRDLFAGG